jgi:DNA primase
VIPAGFIHDLLARVDIVELIGRQVTLKKTGANHMGLCPFHAEKSPSFSVNAGKQFYHCFGCGASGDAIKFLTEQTGASFREAVGDLAAQVGMNVPDEDDNPAAREASAQRKIKSATLSDVLHRASDAYKLALKGNTKAVDYLKRRGLTGVIAARFGLGYAPDGWRHLSTVFARYDDPLLVESGLVIERDADSPTRREPEGDEGSAAADEPKKRYDRFRDRIMFPIRDLSGATIGFGGRVIDAGEPKYLNSPETPVFVKGRELYGLFEARKAIRERGHALVVEGYMDVVALAQWGFAQAVATLGTACTDEHVRKLLRFTDHVVFSFDGDTAGRRAAQRAMEAALPHSSDTRSFKFLFLPTEHDPDSYVREHGAKAFESLVLASVPLSRQLIDTASAGCDFGTAEGRARFVAQAKPLWFALPQGALRSQLLREIATLGTIDVTELSNLWSMESDANQDRRRGREVQSAARPPNPPARTVTTRMAARGPADNIARLLLLRNDWWPSLSEAQRDVLGRCQGWHAALFAWLERHHAEHGAAPWAAMRAALQGEPWAREAMALAESAEFGFEPLQDDLHRAVEQLQQGAPFKLPAVLRGSLPHGSR